MRHRKRFGHNLGGFSGRKRALLRNLASSFILHEVIKTTLPKAKVLRSFVEPLITLAKVDTVAHRRLAFDRLRDQGAVKKLFTHVAPRSKERLGGYVRILKCGIRQGDSAIVAMVEWVDRERQSTVENEA